MSCHRGSERLAEGDNSFWLYAFCVHEIQVGCVGIAIDAALVWPPFTSSVSAIFQCQNIRRRISEKFVNRGAISDIPCVAVEREKRKLRRLTGNPPSVQLRAIIRTKPNILSAQPARVPITSKSIRVIREEDQPRFKYAAQRQHQHVPNENCQKEVEHSLP